MLSFIYTGKMLPDGEPLSLEDKVKWQNVQSALNVEQRLRELILPHYARMHSLACIDVVATLRDETVASFQRMADEAWFYSVLRVWSIDVLEANAKQVKPIERRRTGFHKLIL
jgi:hypothetical protein